VTISGTLFMQIIDPMKTAYGVEDPVDAMNRLAQSTMRTALGNLTLDQVLTSREDLHQLIVAEMNKACEPWGITVLRYNITELHVPRSVQDSMEQLVKANRTARALITEAEGKANAAKLDAAGHKAAIELNSEAEKIKLTNEADGRAAAARAEAAGQADAIRAVAEATAHALEVVATSMTKPGARDAAVVQLTKQYTEAFGELAKTNNSTIFLPTGQTPAEIVASLTQVASRIFASATKT
jgi:regulator of protease activity HflC (stomatin/prohibitin superfamily)